MHEISSLQKTNLSDEIAHYIRKKIIRGQFDSDYHLNEVTLAEELEVSRGPVREALKHLEVEGFVYTPRNGRTRVRTFSKSSFADYQQMRFYLECEACFKIIDTVQDCTYVQWLEEMYTLIDEIAIAEEKGDNPTVNDNDYLFHDKLIERAGSIIFMSMWKPLSGIRRSIMETNRTVQIRESLLSGELSNIHRNILIGLERADKGAVGGALKTHFSSGQSAFRIYHVASEEE
jgi:DNA-binding GntR family transcriptional regulator